MSLSQKQQSLPQTARFTHAENIRRLPDALSSTTNIILYQRIPSEEIFLALNPAFYTIQENELHPKFN